jgi:hypothetical protein
MIITHGEGSSYMKQHFLEEKLDVILCMQVNNVCRSLGLTLSKTFLPMERDSYRQKLLVDYLHHGRKQNYSSLQSFDVADSVGYINLLFNECDDGDDSITDVVNANQIDGIADDESQ